MSFVAVAARLISEHQGTHPTRAPICLYLFSIQLALIFRPVFFVFCFYDSSELLMDVYSWLAAARRLLKSAAPLPCSSLCSVTIDARPPSHNSFQYESLELAQFGVGNTFDKAAREETRDHTLYVRV